MPGAITIRDVPDEVRDELTVRAAAAGQSPQEYLRANLVALAACPAPDVVARARARLAATGTRLDMAAVIADRDLDRR
jgi:plasmid stability protein